MPEERIAKAELERLAHELAGRRLNIVPGPFDTTPGRLIGEMASSNLAIMPSFHEGFGLVGWEAIGCEVPLILGRETGLFKFVDTLLGGAGIGCFHAQSIRGGDLEEEDVESMSKAIINVARDLPRARRDANILRSQLKMEKGCTWRHTALSLLSEVSKRGIVVPCEAITRESEPFGPSYTSHYKPAQFASRNRDHFKQCAELDVSAGQGSTSGQFDLVAELRFGTTPLKVDDMNVDVYVRRAFLRVSSESGKLRGERFGEGRLRAPGVQTLAGGVWRLTDADGGEMLKGKILGNEALCRIEVPDNVSAGARLEVTASPTDLGCKFSLPDNRELSVATRKVMELFLKKAIFREDSGHVVLSEAELQEAR